MARPLGRHRAQANLCAAGARVFSASSPSLCVVTDRRRTLNTRTTFREIALYVMYACVPGRCRSVLARLPREQAGAVNMHERRADVESGVRGPSENRLGQGPGAGRAGARASAPWSGPGGREPTRPLGDLRAGQQPGALRLRVSRLVLAAHDARRRYPRSSLRLARYQDGCDGHPPLCTRALGISAYQQTVSVACP